MSNSLRVQSHEDTSSDLGLSGSKVTVEMGSFQIPASSLNSECLSAEAIFNSEI